MKMVTQCFLQCMRSCRGHWPVAHEEEGNLYSDGTHAAFNEHVRAFDGCVVFVSSEATNQLEPAFPKSDKTNPSEYVASSS